MQKYPTNFDIYNNPPAWAIPPAGMVHHGTDHLAGWIKQNRFYESHIFEIFKDHMPSSGVYLDIGANIGNHSLMFTQMFPDIEVHSFEASPYNFIYLYQNVQSLDNITPYCIGLSNKTEIVKFSHYAEDYGSSGVAEVNDASKQSKGKVFEMDIMLQRYDDLPLSLEPAFIKLDVENYEIPVLDGMMELLDKYSPTLWLEDHPLETSTNLENSPTRHLEKLGYEPIVMCECNVLLKRNK